METFNVVFEGGGVKGIGLVGAVNALQTAGVVFGGLAGTSAGAIIASLLAAGFTGDEIKDIMSSTNYLKFKQKSVLDHFSIVGRVISIFLYYGIYSAEYFEKWIAEILLMKGVRVFGDIKNKNAVKTGQMYKFQAIASDITTKRILVLPDDLHKFGIDADSFSVAKAVRMSMSIPVFFEPYKLYDSKKRLHIIVDGAILSNYPLWLFENAPNDTLSLRFREHGGIRSITEKWEINNFIDYIKSIADTMMEAHDNQHIRFGSGDLKRTIFISSSVAINGKNRIIKATQFGLSAQEVNALYENGKAEGEAFAKRYSY